MSSFTIGNKLYLGVGALVLFTFTLGLTAVLSLSSVGDRVHHIVRSTVKKQMLASDLSLNNAEMLSYMRGILLRGFMKDAGTIEKYDQEFKTIVETVHSEMDAMAPLIVNPEVKTSLQEFRNNLPRVVEAEQLAHRAALAGDMKASTAAYTVMLPIQTSQTALIQRVLHLQESILTEDESGTVASIGTSRWITGGFLALSAAMGLIVVLAVRQINQLLRGSVSELSGSAEQIAAAANQVSSSSQSLAHGASEQAATIEETSSASSEINSMAQRTTESSRTTAGIVSSSEAGFEKANHSLTEMVGAMQDIGASSQKISKIIKVIDEIAFQTNILALNAAVEAARAGEAGMGFAVVADEVRNLAQRCAQAAKDTADLIEESIQKSDDGKSKVDQVAAAIRGITGESTKIKVLVDEINLGSVEQSRGIDQISRSINQMEQVAQGSAASAEETAAAAEELSAQAKTLKDIVSRLTLMVDGRESHSPSRRQAHPSSTPRSLPSRSAPGRKSTSTFTSKLSFPASRSLTVSRAQPVSTASAEFPMDDDFKDF